MLQTKEQSQSFQSNKTNANSINWFLTQYFKNNQVKNTHIHKKETNHCSNDSEVNKTYCSYSGHDLGPQHTHDPSQISVTLIRIKIK